MQCSYEFISQHHEVHSPLVVETSSSNPSSFIAARRRRRRPTTAMKQWNLEWNGEWRYPSPRGMMLSGSAAETVFHVAPTFVGTYLLFLGTDEHDKGICPQADSFFGFFFGFGFFFPGTTTTSAGKKEEKVKFWVLTSRVLFVCCPHRPLENDRSETQYLIE